MSHTVLLVEDDESLGLGLADNLEDAGYRPLIIRTAREAAARLSQGGFDAVLLDVMLPDGDGYTLCRDYRAQGGQAPVLMLTARTLEEDLVRGLGEGADDYLAKPYRVKELLARLAALLRRHKGPTPTSADQLGEFTVDRNARTVTGPQGAVDLTRKEYELLCLFLERTNQALSRDEILDKVWGTDVVVDGRTVDNFVWSLKKKLSWQAHSPWRIQGVRGVGYRLERHSAATRT